MAKIKHGCAGTPLYNVWKSMRQRCNNKKCSDYKWYGGCGIQICAEWNDFENFKNWALKNGYKAGLTIERKDSKSGYCPDNCEWVTIQMQQKNKRNVLRFEYMGISHTVETFCEMYGISKSMFYDRRHKGWTIDRIAKTPKVPSGGYRKKGVHFVHG